MGHQSQVQEASYGLFDGVVRCRIWGPAVPGTSHGLLVEKPERCNTLIIDYLSNEPVPTLAPIRRAAP